MSRPLLVALLGVIAVIFVSWMLGELLRQRKTIDTKSRRARRKPTKASGRQANE